MRPPPAESGAPADKCKIVFKTDKLAVERIPGIAEYRDALVYAKRTHARTPSVLDHLVRIERALEHDYVDVLFVTDCGKGFNDESLESVLGEGSPRKGSGFRGCFGVGHLTAYALSELQYIFYASKQHNRVVRAAGHAILSSQNRGEKGGTRSCHGYFLKKHEFNADNLRTPCKGSAEVPAFLRKELDKFPISGSVICALGFNRERLCGSHSVSIADAIRRAAAHNFAVAICEGSLEVSVIDKGKKTSINRTNMEEFLTDVANNSTIPKKDRKLAEQTLSRIECFTEPSKHGTLKHPFSDCRMYMRYGADEPKVSIWRNGMLITGAPNLRMAAFSKLQPFNALVHLSSEGKTRTAHDIVQKAETPMHNTIKPSMLASDADIAQLRRFNEAMKDWIAANGEASGGDEHELSDEMMIAMGDSELYSSDLPRIMPSGSSLNPDDPQSPLLVSNASKTRNKRNKRRRDRTTKVRRMRETIRAQGKWRQGKYVLQIMSEHELPRGQLSIEALPGTDPSSEWKLPPGLVTVVKAVQEDGTILEQPDGEHVILDDLRAHVPITLTLQLAQKENDLRHFALQCVVSTSDGPESKTA